MILVVCGYAGGPGNTTTVTDTLGQMYPQVGAEQTSGEEGSTDQRVTLFRKENASGSATTPQCNFSPNVSSPDIIVVEFSGIATASAFDRVAQDGQDAPGTGMDAVTSGNTSMATTAVNELGFAVGVTNYGDLNFTAGSNFTERREQTNGNGNHTISIETRNLPTADVYAGTFTFANAAFSGVIFATFKEPAGAGLPQGAPLLMWGQ